MGRRDLWAVAVLAGLVAIAFRDVLGASDGLWFGDHDLAFRRRWWFVIDTIRAGHLPTRTLAHGSGVPIESILNATYTPLVLLFAVGPFDIMYDWFVAGHVLLACLGVYALFRSLGFSAMGAFWAALVPLAGPIVSFENLVIILQGLAYAPWTYWAVARLLRQPNLRNVGWLGLWGGWHLQGITPEVMLMDLLVGVVLLAVVRPSWRAAPALAAGLVLAFAASAVELMPVLESLSNTRRGQGFSYTEQSYWSVHPWRLISVLVPSFWSLPEIGEARFQGLFGGRPRPYLLSLYAGLLVSMAVGLRRPSVIALAVAAGFVVIGLGPLTPLHGLVARLPVMTSARYPVKFMALAMAAVAVALAYAPRAWAKSKGPPWPLAAHAAVAIGLWVVLTSASFTSALPTMLSPPSRDLLGVEPGFLVELVRLAQGHRLGHAVAVPALALLAVTVVKAPRSRLLALTAIAALDVAWAAGYAIQGGPVDVRPADDLHHAIRGLQRRVYRLGPNDRRAPLTVDPSLKLYEQSMVAGARRGTLSYRDVRAFYDYDAEGQSNPSSAAAFDLIRSHGYPEAEVLLGRAGVHAVSTWARLPRPGLTMFPIEGQVSHYVFPLQPHRPYVDAFSEWRRIRPESMRRPDNVAHLTRLSTWDVLLVLDPSAPSPRVEGSPATDCRRQAVVRAEPPSPNGDVAFHADVPCEAMVLIQETYHPRWTATVDGRPAPVFVAEMGQTAVLVPAGAHRVSLRYVGRAERWAMISLLGLLVSLVLATARGPKTAGSPARRHVQVSRAG